MATKAIVNLDDMKVLDGVIQADISVLYADGAQMAELATQKVFGTIPVGLTEGGITSQLKTIASGMLSEFAGLTIQTAEIVRGK